MRILCLPGWRTNGAVLEYQLNAGLCRGFDPATEWVYLDGKFEATGAPDPAIAKTFGTSQTYYEWWNSVDRKYRGLDESVAHVLEVVKEKGPFDVLVGFSQGAMLLGFLQAYVEKHPDHLPAHLKWKASILLAAPSARDEEAIKRYFHDNQRLGTMCPMYFMIGEFDPYKDRCDALLPMFPDNHQKIVISYPEGHQPPTWAKSKQQIQQVANEIKQRQRWWAFDFDGVLCDSAVETCLSGIKACRLLFPEMKFLPDDQLIPPFLYLRPRLEHGFHSILMSYMANQEMLAHPDKDPVKDIAAELANKIQYENYFQVLLDEILAKHNLNSDQLQQGFHKARNQWIEQDFAGWLDANNYYQTIVDAVKRLVDTNAPVYIITTKHKDFAYQLVQKINLNVPEQRIFGQGMGSKEDVLNKLAQENLGSPCFFIEDRVETLTRVSTKLHFPCELAFATWGYNDESDQSIAQQHKFQVFQQQQFAAMIEKL